MNTDVQPIAETANCAVLSPAETSSKNAHAVAFRPYQASIFCNRTAGILILHWSRQIGKSHVLAHWATCRLIRQLEKYPTWLVTVLSNSRENGAEFCLKAAEACRVMNASIEAIDISPNLVYENMRLEIRITRRADSDKDAETKHVGRIKILAANPRTARGFSGDLILDEFAFHENSNAIWEAAEPILAANPEFLCRIASTGNGRHNLFYHCGYFLPGKHPAVRPGIRTRTRGGVGK